MNKMKKGFKAVLILCMLAFCATGLVGCEDEDDKITEDKKEVEYNESESGEIATSSENETQVTNEIAEEDIDWYTIAAENELAQKIYMSAIDLVMNEAAYGDGYKSDYYYWDGIKRAVARLYGDKNFNSREITKSKYAGMMWYEVSGSVVEEIGQAMWNEIESMSYVPSEIRYDSEEDKYYFEITEPLDYYFDITNAYEISEEDSDVGEVEICGYTTLSRENSYAYSVKEYRIKIQLCNENRFGIAINDVVEDSYQSEMSIYERNSDVAKATLEDIMGSEYLDCIMRPWVYVNAKNKGESDKQLVWHAIYEAASDCCKNYAFSDNQYEKVKIEKKKYWKIDANVINALADVYLGKENLSVTDIPSDLKDKITYLEEENKYLISNKGKSEWKFYNLTYFEFIDDEYIIYAGNENSDDATKVYLIEIKYDKDNMFGFNIKDIQY